MSAAPSSLPPPAARLLVLLPLALTHTARRERAATLAALSALQRQLGADIRVLRIDEASHPAVVHSFDGQGLPAFVLIREGVELWRQQGLPEGEGMAAQLLGKLRPAMGATELV